MLQRSLNTVFKGFLGMSLDLSLIWCSCVCICHKSPIDSGPSFGFFNPSSLCVCGATCLTAWLVCDGPCSEFPQVCTR